MEIKTLWVIEINGQPHYFKSMEDRTYFVINYRMHGFQYDEIINGKRYVIEL